MSAVITAPDHITGKDLVARLEEPLRRVYTEDLDRPIEADRISKILQSKRNYLYWQGKQYLKPKFSADDMVVDWVSVLDDPALRKKVKFASVYNIIYADGIKFIAVVGQRRPNQKCVPDDANNDYFQNLTRDADAAMRYLHRKWKLRRRMKEIAFHLWTTGPVFGYTHYVTDGMKYGHIEVPNIEIVHETVNPGGFRCVACGAKATAEVCPSCGTPMTPETYESADVQPMPIEHEPFRYENGCVELDLLSRFYVATPPLAKDLSPEECPWLSYKDMISKGKARMLAPHVDFAEMVEGEDNADREAADAIEETGSESGAVTDVREQEQYTREHRWIYPEVYESLSMSMRKRLKREFPNGLHSYFIGGKLIEVSDEKLSDYWAVCKTGTGEYVNSPALCTGMIPIQDDINDYMNLGKETVVRGIPKTLIDSQLLNPDIGEDATVAEFIPVNVGGTMDIGKMFGQLPMSRFSDQMIPLMATSREFSREVGGVRPEISGGGDTTNTWREAAQRKNQALMQLQPPFEEMQEFTSEASENGIREWARFGVGNVVVPPNKYDGLEDSYRLNVPMLEEEGWHVEAEESVPVSFGEKLDRIQTISQENPQLAATIGITHPINAPEMQQYFGIEGMYAPLYHEREKAMRRIKRLLQEEPIIVGIDPMTGQPMEEPSIQPDPFTDQPHQFYADIFRAWCNSEVGGNTEEQNLAGYRNVWLHGQRQEQMAIMTMMPPEEGAPTEAQGGAPAGPPSSSIPPVTGPDTGAGR